MLQHIRRGRRPIQAFLAATLLAGCSVGPDFREPNAPAGPATPALPAATVSSKTTGGAAQVFAEGRDIPGDWWTLFGSRQIESMVQQALRANPDLPAAQATLREARENTRAEEGAFFPSITGSLSAGREQTTLASFGAGNTSTLFSLYSGSLNVSYTLDVFGSTRRQVEQLGAQATYQKYELEAAYLSLTTNLVAAIFTESSLKAQIDTTEALIKLYTDALDITQRRFTLGGVSRADVLQQQASLAAEAATLPGLQKQYAQQRNLVANYLGVLPGQYTAPTIDLATLKLPGEIPVSLRPNWSASARTSWPMKRCCMPPRPRSASPPPILSAIHAHRQLWARGHRSVEAVHPDRPGLEHRQFAFAAHLRGWYAAGPKAIGGGGTRCRRGAIQQHAEHGVPERRRFAGRHRGRCTRAASATRPEQTAADSLAVTQAQFAAGATTYLNLLQAQQTYQSARLQLVSAQAARFTDTVALYQSLGGGWWNRKDVDPKVDACCGIMP